MMSDVWVAGSKRKGERIFKRWSDVKRETFST